MSIVRIMTDHRSSICAVLFLLASILAQGCAATHNEEALFIDNGEVELGVDLTAGGSIFFFSESRKPRNLLNHHDKGRFIQQSYYGDEDGSRWIGKPWRWNPVQGGDTHGNCPRLLHSSRNESGIYTKSIPKHWATGEEINDALMEQWISLDGKVAHIHYRFSYCGDHDHEPRHQELPAVFVDYDLPNLVLYEGEEPWTGRGLKETVPGWPNEMKKSDECWAAYTDGDGWGIGVYFPGTNRITCYRYEGPGGPSGSGCSYFAPIRTMDIKAGLIFEYDVFLTIGTVGQIRKRFADIRAKE